MDKMTKLDATYRVAFARECKTKLVANLFPVSAVLT